MAAACGQFHSVAVSADGSVHAWGANFASQLGDGQEAQQPTPVLLTSLSQVKAISAAGEFSHTLALKDDGTLWAWGFNTFGQLGDGSTADSYLPVQVNTPSRISAMTAGHFHTLAVSGGTLLAWGNNSDGQLGDGTLTDRLLPTPVNGLATVTQVAGGYAHSVALLADGSVWAWGNNEGGQLGNGSLASSAQPLPIAGIATVTAIASGADHVLALLADGTVWAWGANYDGQIGNATRDDALRPVQVPGLVNIGAIAAGDSHSMAVGRDGTLWTWGGRYIDVYGADYDVEIAVDTTTPQAAVELDHVATAAGGYSNAFALKTDGTVWARGYNFTGQIGDGTLLYRSRYSATVNPTFNGFLDLAPGTPKLPVAAEQQPAFFLSTAKSGNNSATSLAVTVRSPASLGSVGVAGSTGRTGTAGARRTAQAAASYKMFVAASATPNGTPVFFQLEPSHEWSRFTTWPMSAYLSNVALDSADSTVRLQILDAADLSQLGGASVIVGYGIDADEMLSAKRFRVVFSVPKF